MCSHCLDVIYYYLTKITYYYPAMVLHYARIQGPVNQIVLYKKDVFKIQQNKNCNARELQTIIYKVCVSWHDHQIETIDFVDDSRSILPKICISKFAS